MTESCKLNTSGSSSVHSRIFGPSVRHVAPCRAGFEPTDAPDGADGADGADGGV